MTQETDWDKWKLRSEFNELFSDGDYFTGFTQEEVSDIMAMDLGFRNDREMDAEMPSRIYPREIACDEEQDAVFDRVQSLICSIFTPTIYASDECWHIENRGSGTWMSQCRIYHPRSAKKFVADLENSPRLQTKCRQIDAAVGGWAEENGVNIWFHSPSLTQHISPQNTSYETKRYLDARIGYARDFIGENRSIHEYWTEFGTNPRKKRILPRLEIVARVNSQEDGVPFQFTPEMALDLAYQLDQHNCDVGELSFVGDDLLAWEYAGRCVYPLQITGKIMRTKLTLSLIKEVNLKPYELLFDAVDIIDDGTQPHLIEKYVGKNQRCTRAIKNHRTTECTQVPRLLGNDVFLCSRIGYQTMAGHRFEPAPETDCRYALEDFFQNFDELSVEFGKQKTCHSCRSPLHEGL